MEVEVQVEIERTTQLPTQAKTQLTTLVPELRRILRGELVRIILRTQEALRRAFKGALRGAMSDEPRVIDPFPAVGLTSSAVKLESFVDWVVFGIVGNPEPDEPAEACSRELPRSGVEAVESAEEIL
jgi:hypothetical protein